MRIGRELPQAAEASKQEKKLKLERKLAKYHLLLLRKEKEHAITRRKEKKKMTSTGSDRTHRMLSSSVTRRTTGLWRVNTEDALQSGLTYFVELHFFVR